MVIRVVVIGAGIIGLSSAIQIQEKVKNCHVTIIADSVSPETTADGSGGFWKPHMLGDTPLADIRRWSESTWHHLLSLTTGLLAGKLGLQLVSGYMLSKNDPYQVEWYNDLVLGYRLLTPRELKMFPIAKSGVFYTTLQMNPVAYMAHMSKRFMKNGGSIIKKTLHNLQEVSDEYDVIVNCSGARAKYLIGDQEIQPIRGHLTKLKAPWLKHFVGWLEGPDVTFMLPGPTHVTIGGVDEVGSWNKEAKDFDNVTTLRRICKHIPSLKDAEVIGHWVGIRPGRSSVRLEAEKISINGKSLTVIHNYGHGGSGVTVHWGCAEDVADMVIQENQLIFAKL